MPVGRTLDFCSSKRCRHDARRRGRPVDGPTETVDAFVGFLRRVERTTATRVGAGVPIADAWDGERWRRELEDDLADTPELAGHLLAGVRANLREVETAADVHRVFDLMLDRIPVLVPALDRARAELDPSPHLVYLLHDRRGRLLFVGVADRGPRQLAEIHGGKAWFRDVTRVDFERTDSAEQAADRARSLIDERRPAFS